MILSRLILRLLGWTVHITVPDYRKAIICVAPHTSNLDFFIGKLAYASVGRKAGFLMKKAWFFFPLGVLLRAMGGVPVDRSSKAPSLVDALIERYGCSERLVLVVTPEGTRKRVERWHTGFLRIAEAADIPVLLGVIDFATKRVIIKDLFVPSGDVEADMRRVKNYYKPYCGKYPGQFAT